MTARLGLVVLEGVEIEPEGVLVSNCVALLLNLLDLPVEYLVIEAEEIRHVVIQLFRKS